MDPCGGSRRLPPTMKRFAWILSVLGLVSNVGGCATHHDSGPAPLEDPSVTSDDEPVPPAEDPRTSETPSDPAPPMTTVEPPETSTDEPSDAPSTTPDQTPPPPSDETPPPAAPSPLFSVPGANITIDGVAADGQRLDRLECRASDLPMLGALAVVASIAEAKPALDRCAPKGAAVALTWTFEGGKARDIELAHASSPAVGRCVAKAMRRVVAPFSAQCGATVLVGDDTGADAALLELRASADAD